MYNGKVFTWLIDVLNLSQSDLEFLGAIAPVLWLGWVLTCLLAFKIARRLERAERELQQLREAPP